MGDFGMASLQFMSRRQEELFTEKWIDWSRPVPMNQP
jgi:hypothetical protein